MDISLSSKLRSFSRKQKEEYYEERFNEIARSAQTPQQKKIVESARAFFEIKVKASAPQSSYSPEAIKNANRLAAKVLERKKDKEKANAFEKAKARRERKKEKQAAPNSSVNPSPVNPDEMAEKLILEEEKAKKGKEKVKEAAKIIIPPPKDASDGEASDDEICGINELSGLALSSSPSSSRPSSSRLDLLLSPVSPNYLSTSCASNKSPWTPSPRVERWERSDSDQRSFVDYREGTPVNHYADLSDSELDYLSCCHRLPGIRNYIENHCYSKKIDPFTFVMKAEMNHRGMRIQGEVRFGVSTEDKSIYHAMFHAKNKSKNTSPRLPQAMKDKERDLNTFEPVGQAWHEEMNADGSITFNYGSKGYCVTIYPT